jgi:N-acetylated-alpha-linked acidic dipeptidase
MWNVLLVLSLFAIGTLACQRDFPDQHFPFQFTDSLEHLDKRAETFPPVWTEAEEILHTSFDTIELETWASYYTHGDHIAGRNKSMAEATAHKWNENGIVSSLVEYEVFLNYPEEQSLVLKVGAGNGSTTYECQLWEDRLDQDETTRYTNSVPAFHGYSASGEMEAEYVYVGRGHKDDFEALKQAGIQLKDKIALVKYGGPFRGVKVKNAEVNGMIGVVIFTDPGSDGPQEAKGDKAYPNGPARNPSSLQRGSVAYIHQYVGDPTTPGYPSKPGAQRVESPLTLPKIPSIPISQRDALPLLQKLNGHGSTLKRDGWTGGLDSKYSSGPAPGATLALKNKMRDATTPIWNVIGIINGTTEANETIIIGNHRDAWIIGGAADPNSGSAMLIEITKAFGKLLKTGWKPKRNIIFASWDAEEYALVGSTEWVEEFAPWLSQTAVSYLNVDIAVNGPLPGASSTPELRGIAQEVMKKVIYGNGTLYDAWYDLYRFQPEDNGFGDLGSGSDYTAFLQLGIGALDFGMGPGIKDPVYHYHSNYDSFHWMKTFVDPDFKIHTTAGQFMTLLAYHLADDVLLPFDLDAYGRNLGYWTRDVVGITTGMRNPGQVQTQMNLTQLITSYHRFQAAAEKFTSIIGSSGFLNNTVNVLQANTKLKEMQRLFVTPQGLPGRPFYKNALYAPNRDDGYKAQTFPGVVEGLQDMNLTQAREWSLFLVDAINKASDLLTFT